LGWAHPRPGITLGPVSRFHGSWFGETGRAALALLEALDTHRATTMSGDRLEVNVTFDERGYIGSAPELRSPVMALSLGGLRRKVEALMVPDSVVAEREWHRRRAQAQLPTR
jgi:hypothetical protein